MIYAPGFYTGYGVKTLPGIREGLEQRNWNEVDTYIQEVAKVFNNLKETVAAFENVNMPEGLGDEMQKMKETVKELNAKYEAMLGAMNK